MHGFNSYTLKNIIKDLHKIKVHVSVPRAAIVTEAEIVLYGDPVDFINGEAVKGSALERVAVVLPLSKVIDVFHSDYSISVTDRKDLLKIMNALISILERLENSINGKDDDAFEYINEFYTSILKQNKTRLSRRSIQDKPKVIGLSGTTTTNYVDVYRGSSIDLSDILVN